MQFQLHLFFSRDRDNRSASTAALEQDLGDLVLLVATAQKNEI
jgi:hypothetical protein